MKIGKLPTSGTLGDEAYVLTSSSSLNSDKYWPQDSAYRDMWSNYHYQGMRLLIAFDRLSP